MDGGENDYAGFSVIGQSPFASTYRAFLPRLHAPVVVRVFASVIAEAPDAEERFVAEIRAIAAIDDPRLEPPVELGTSERGDLYVTRRRLSDESLGRLAEQGRLLGLPEALRVGAELADVAAHLDRRGVAHHAISPNNTFIGADGAVVVTDPIPAIALEGVPLGLRSRPAHVAPEILAGQPWTSAAESYSIMSTVTSILGHQALPTLITELVDECLAPEPTRRPAPAELAALLREARADLLTPRAPRRRRVIEEPQTGAAPLGPNSAPAGIAQTGAAAATAPPAASREPIVIDLRERGAHPADMAAAANAARLVPARGERSEPDEPGDAAGRPRRRRRPFRSEPGGTPSARARATDSVLGRPGPSTWTTRLMISTIPNPAPTRWPAPTGSSIRITNAAGRRCRSCRSCRSCRRATTLRRTAPTWIVPW